MKKFYVPAIIEQHIHGGFGVNFNTCDLDGLTYFAKRIKDFGVCAFLPTIHTDKPEIMNKQLKLIKKTAQNQKNGKGVKILGVHLEGPFISPLKKGVHNEDDIKIPNFETYKKITAGAEDFVKIVTLAPELDIKNEFTNYLNSKGVTVSAGHTLATDLSMVRQVTHLFNAMGGIDHKKPSTANSALISDDIYTELIADGNHITDDVLKLVFKAKPKDKIILISDALPIAHSDNETETFMGQEISQNGNCALTKNGTMAGSALFVFDIIKRLVNNGFLSLEEAFKMGSENIKNNLKLEIGHGSMLEIDEKFNILSME